MLFYTTTTDSEIHINFFVTVGSVEGVIIMGLLRIWVSKHLDFSGSSKSLKISLEFFLSFDCFLSSLIINIF